MGIDYSEESTHYVEGQGMSNMCEDQEMHWKSRDGNKKKRYPL
jgi:hypothetical protein